MRFDQGGQVWSFVKPGEGVSEGSDKNQPILGVLKRVKNGFKVTKTTLFHFYFVHPSLRKVLIQEEALQRKPTFVSGQGRARQRLDHVPSSS